MLINTVRNTSCGPLTEGVVETINLPSNNLYRDLGIGLGITGCCGGTMDNESTINKTVMGIQLGFNLDKSKLLDPEVAKTLVVKTFATYGFGDYKFRDKCARFFRYIDFKLGDVDVTMKVSTLMGIEDGQQA